jgi:hypothetical protein
MEVLEIAFDVSDILYAELSVHSACFLCRGHGSMCHFARSCLLAMQQWPGQWWVSTSKLLTHSLSVQDKPLLIYVHKDSVQHVSWAAKMPTINSHTATARVEE